MSELNELLDELEALSKAIPAPDAKKGDAKIAAAADDDEPAEPDGDEESDEAEGDGDAPREEDEDEDEDAEDERLGKSFSARLDDGSEIQAYDGTELVKSLLLAHETQSADLLKAVGATTVAVREMQKLLKAQSTELHTLRDEVTRIGGEGRGRKAVLNVHEKPALDAASAPEGMSSRELMTKAMSAFRQGRISGTEVAMLEVSVAQGMPPPGHLVEKL